LHEYAKTARVCWIADHLDAVLAQTLATRCAASAADVECTKRCWN